MATKTVSRPSISKLPPSSSDGEGQHIRKDQMAQIVKSSTSSLRRQSSRVSDKVPDIRRSSDWRRISLNRGSGSVVSLASDASENGRLITGKRRSRHPKKQARKSKIHKLLEIPRFWYWIFRKIHQFGRALAAIRQLQGSDSPDARSKQEKARVRFKSIVTLTMGCSRLIQAYSLRFRDDDELTPFIQQLTFRDYNEGEEEIGLQFDPTRFKANKQLRIPDETIRVLAKPPFERTEKDLYNVQIALRNIKSISEYPVRMQRLIAANGVYYKYGAKRIVVRQGHPATGFYFILSGSVVVMIMDQENKYARPVAYLSKGMTFGELAIINRTNRQSSVIAKETLELLCISIDDFHRIFMNGGVKNINDPDHNEFINRIGFLRGWPVEIMGENPNKCIFNYFKEDEVLVKDSNYSNWIYVVKSGSLNVLKRLKKVNPFEGSGTVSPNRSMDQPEIKTAKQLKEENDKIEMERKCTLSEIKIPMRHQADIFESRSLTQIRLIGLTSTTPAFSLTTPESETSEKYIRHKETILPSIAESNGIIRSQTQSQVVSSSLRAKEKTRIKSVPPRPTRVSMSNTSPSLGSKRRTLKRHVTTLPAGESPEGEDDDDEISKEMMGFKQTIRTITDDIDASYNLRDPNETTEADLNPQYVHLNTLTKGQVFGISQTLLGPQPSMCVVSNGAECILIDKQFYLHHASADLKQRLRAQLCPYPSDAVLQASLQDTVDWQAFRQDTVQRVLTDIESKRLFELQKIPQKG